MNDPTAIIKLKDVGVLSEVRRSCIYLDDIYCIFSRVDVMNCCIFRGTMILFCMKGVDSIFIFSLYSIFNLF